MKQRWLLILFLVSANCLPGWTAAAAEEEALLQLWKSHVALPDDHAATIKACRDFAGAHAADPLLPVVRGLEAWHHWRAGRQVDALQMMAADLSAPPGAVNDGARRLAMGWITRVDREQLAGALQAHYRKQVAYPKTLDQLPAEARSSPHDRFGKPWNYRLTGFAKLKGFTDQKYSLESVVLGDTSDLKTALKLPYAARLSAVPSQVLAGPSDLPAVKFNVAGSAAVVGLGQAAGHLFLAFVGTHAVVVCDYTHWKVFPRP